MPTFLPPLGVIRQFNAGSLSGRLALVGLTTTIGVFFGLLASTANPIYIGLGVGLLLGTLLMAKPAWSVWVILFVGLLVTGIMPIWFPELGTKAVWGLSIVGFMLLLRAWGEAIAVSGAVRHTPSFVWLALGFVLYALVNTLMQLPSAYVAFSGFKRYFQVIGLLFALAWLPFSAGDIRRWRVFFLIVALLQFPWALYENLELAPIREGYVSAYPHLHPLDVVAGTFGANMYEGGANGEMAHFLIIMLAFLLARLSAGLISIGRFLLLLPLVVAPLILGETKVVVVSLPLMFLALYRGQLIARPHLALVGLMLGAALTFGALAAYVAIGQTSLEDLLDETLSYNVYDKGYASNELNRTSVLTFWLEHQGLHDPAGTVLGQGLGAAHDDGPLGLRYKGYGIDLTAASFLLWEQGVIGTILFLSILGLAWPAANRIRNSATSSAKSKADSSAIQASLPVFALHLIYGPAQLQLFSFQIVFYGLLGYLAWLFKRHSEAAAPSKV